MRERSRRKARWPVVALPFVPAIVVAARALLQTVELDIPPLPQQCPRQCAERVLAQIAHDRSEALTFAWGAAALLLVLGTAAAIVLSVRQRAPRTTALERQRAALVSACVDVSDVVSGALREQLVDALAEAGVTSVQVAAGEPFDSSRHHAVGRVDTSDPAHDNLVAETQRTGYIDRGKRLRYPDVVVFKADGGLG